MIGTRKIKRLNFGQLQKNEEKLIALTILKNIEFFDSSVSKVFLFEKCPRRVT